MSSAWVGLSECQHWWGKRIEKGNMTTQESIIPTNVANVGVTLRNFWIGFTPHVSGSWIGWSCLLGCFFMCWSFRWPSVAGKACFLGLPHLQFCLNIEYPQVSRFYRHFSYFSDEHCHLMGIQSPFLLFPLKTVLLPSAPGEKKRLILRGSPVSLLGKKPAEVVTLMSTAPTDDYSPSFLFWINQNTPRG